MSGRWWRAYSRARHDPKLLKLSDKQFRWWFNLVCVAADNDGVLPSHADLAVEFRVNGKVMTEALDALVAAGLLDHDETGVHPHNWNGLQYKHDVSTERVKRFRQRRETVSETPSESETETETDTEADTEQKEATPPSQQERSDDDKPFKLTDEWRPSADSRDYAIDKGLNPEAVCEEFLDYFVTGNGKSQKRTASRWERRWRIWCNRNAGQAPTRPQRVRTARASSDAEAFAFAIDRLGRDEPVQ